VNVRIIAATHQNLEQLVREGRFREDLYHRLNVIRIHLPRLRERREDIARLARHFLKRAADELGGDMKVLLPETEAFIANLPWPGNVRQLENACRWLTVMASGREVHVADLPPELLQSDRGDAEPSNWVEQLRGWASTELRSGHFNLLQTAVEKFETAMIDTALTHTQGRRAEAAQVLGWGRNTLTRKIKEYGLGDDRDDGE
jgi:two-component system nitrogen regulation response regulator GlnG